MTGDDAKKTTTAGNAKLGLGLAALGRPGYITVGHAEDLDGQLDVASMEERCHAVLDAAWSAGVRWFDAARSYGLSEEFLAGWLRKRQIAPGEVTVSSKWGYTYAAAWQIHAKQHEIKDHSLAALDRQRGETHALVGSYLSLYQVHSATLDSGILADTRVLGRLGELRDRGLRVGLTLSGPEQAKTLERALDITVQGRPLWSAVQATWNLLERSVEPALRTAKSAGLTVLVKEALSNGRLAGTRAPELLQEEARRRRVGPDAVALAAVLAQPFVDVVLLGAATPAQVTENAMGRELNGAAAATACSSLAEPPERYWAERAQLAWH